VKYCDEHGCVSVMSNDMSKLHKIFLYMFLPVTMAWSCSDDNTTADHLLPVLRMTSCLSVIGGAKATLTGFYTQSVRGQNRGVKS